MMQAVLTLLSNSEFIVMLNQTAGDREKLACLLNISEEQTGLQDAAKAPRQVETPVKTAKRPAQTAGQTMPVVRTETVSTTQTIETDDGADNLIEEEVEVTTTTLYITVTQKTADEMADVYSFTADQRAQLAELLSEGNRSLWNSVLYSIGRGDGEITAVALSQLGNVGGQPYWSWYGFNSRVEWCAIFVSWCADQCGYLDAGVIPRFAGCVQGSRWFKERGLWQGRDYEPRSGEPLHCGKLSDIRIWDLPINPSEA